MKQIIGILLVGLFFISCGSNQTTNAQGEVVQLHDGPDFYGEKFEVTKAVDLKDIMTQLQSRDSVNVLLQAKVDGVCQAKGCWMNLVSDKNAEGEIFVKFKDYGFFMPMDIAGRKVIANGVAYKEVTSIDELRHYAEDGGASKEEIAAINTPKEELKFMATGVKLLAEK